MESFVTSSTRAPLEEIYTAFTRGVLEAECALTGAAFTPP
jgi:hypothetical protein